MHCRVSSHQMHDHIQNQGHILSAHAHSSRFLLNMTTKGLCLLQHVLYLCSWVQVLLYAIEDFEFADFLHLAVFHTRNRFAESPLGISPRIWNSQPPADPILLTPVHRLLPDNYTTARDHVSRHGKRKCKVFVPHKPEVQPVTEAEVKLATSPQMEKWLKMMQSGGIVHLTVQTSAMHAMQLFTGHLEHP